jgi:vacuolar-type H+-ATPase subunit C/Vma6
MTGGSGAQSEMLTYNVDNGFPEAILRTLRKGILNGQHYENMKLANNIVEFRLTLEDTDYGNAPNEEAIFHGQEDGKLESKSLGFSMQRKLKREMEYIMG